MAKQGVHGVAGLALGCAALMAGVGCESAPQAEATLIDALRAENTELRSANDELQGALERSQGQSRGLVDEREQLVEENASLREQMAGMQTQPREIDTGFTGDVSLRGSDIVVTVAGDVLFQPGSVTLRAEAQRTLDEVASVIRSRYGSNEIRIAGHSDRDPIRRSKWETNERLSAERALAVEEYLATKGVSKDRMHVAGFGPAQPRGSKAQSRRVEIIVLGGAS